MMYDIVLLSGGFDPAHVGHVRMVRSAAMVGRKVVIGINSDEWLVRKKGYSFMPLNERKEIMGSFAGAYMAKEFDDSDDTANGKGLKLPLVISTSIKANDLNGNKINKIANNNLALFFILLASLLRQNLTVNLSISHNQSLVLLKVGTVVLLLMRFLLKLCKRLVQVYSF